jgi:hypothetical protein
MYGSAHSYVGQRWQNYARRILFMSLTSCPECGHEVSTSAVSCPGCGHSMRVDPSVVEPTKRVVVAQRRDNGFPPWALVPIGIAAVLLFFFAYIMLREGGDDSNTNVNVKLEARGTASDTTRDSQSTDIPSSSDRVTMPDDRNQVPETSSVPASSTTVPGTSEAPVRPPDRGTVKITARVMMPRTTGPPQPVRSTKFYLLDKDLATILSEARVEPIEGNSYAASLGLAAVFPDRYGDFQRAAMRAIARYVKYTGTTDNSGSAILSNVDPKEYYIFGITKIGRGFAMWDAPVSINVGENILNLSPPNVTEIPDTSG